MATDMNNNEWLSFLHQLHCKIRSARGIKLTGIPALNEINNFLLLKFAEKYMDKENLGEKCKFSYLYKTYATNKKIAEDKKRNQTDKFQTNSYLLWESIYDIKGNDKCVMKLLTSNEFFKKYLFNDVTKSTAYTSKLDIQYTVQEIINYIHKKLKNVTLNYDFFDAFGAAYESFKTDAVGADGKRTGQHFTPVAIKKFIVDEIKPKFDETVYECCAGSGGFIHTAFSYVQHNDPDNASIFKKKIYANECNPEIIKPLMMNMLLHEIPVKHIQECDSLSRDNCKAYHNKFDIIVTNPPFGMSTEITPEIYPDNYWDSLRNGKTMIKDSSGQFVIHIFNSLKENGRTGFVIDRGILNNGNGDKSWQTRLRKFLIENTNLYKIILLPTGIFTYTNFATAIIFFTKGEKTTEVKIYDGKFEDTKKKTGLIVDDNKPIKVFTRKELKSNGYSLKINNDVKEEIMKGFVKLGEICELKRGEILTKNDMVNGKIPVISAGMGIMGYHNKSNRDKNTIVISASGYAGYVSMYPTKIWACDCFSVIPKDDTILNGYVYYYLKIKQNEIYKLRHGQAQQHINFNDMYPFSVPSLQVTHQQEIVTLLDEIFKTHDINKLPEIIKDVPIFNLLIQKRYDDFADAIHLIYRKIEMDEELKKIEHDKKAIFKWMLYGSEYKEYKLGELIHFKRGKMLTAADMIQGDYPVIGGGRNPSGKHNEFNRNANAIVCSSSGSYAGYINRYDTKIWASDCFTLHTNDKTKLLNDYLFDYLKFYQDDIYKLQKGNGQPHVYAKDIAEYMFKLPDIETQKGIIRKINETDVQRMIVQTYSDDLERQINSMFKIINDIVVDIKKDDTKVSEKHEEITEENDDVQSNENEED